MEQITHHLWLIQRPSERANTMQWLDAATKVRRMAMWTGEPHLIVVIDLLIPRASEIARIITPPVSN